jgi:hypothetical protein
MDWATFWAIFSPTHLVTLAGISAAATVLEICIVVDCF